MRIQYVTIRCRFSVQCGRHEKLVYVVGQNVALDLERTPYNGFDLGNAARLLREGVRDALIGDLELRDALAEAALDVARRNEASE